MARVKRTRRVSGRIAFKKQGVVETQAPRSRDWGLAREHDSGLRRECETGSSRMRGPDTLFGYTLHAPLGG